MFTAGMMPHLLVSLGKTLRYQFKCHPENIKVLLLSQKSEFPEKQKSAPGNSSSYLSSSSSAKCASFETFAGLHHIYFECD